MGIFVLPSSATVMQDPNVIQNPTCRLALHAPTSWLQGRAEFSITHLTRLLNRPEDDDSDWTIYLISANAAELPWKELVNDRLSYSNGAGTLSLNCYHRGGAGRA